jgi:UDP-N-acetyl-D-mannosaminuronate dehydrogenase
VLNVCIPQIKNFEEVVIDIANRSNSKMIIIHSTIKVGTTESISKKTNCDVAHSPVRGIHPNLLDGILTFVKYVGSDNIESSSRVVNHLKSLGVKAVSLKSSRETEIGKLLDTTYYGICISWHGEMKKMCDEIGADFEEAVTLFNETYNSGYIKLGKSNVVRPVLFPPESKIGGHCVVPNAKILNETFKSEGLDMILKYSRDNE